MADPSAPTYAAGTISLMSTDINADGGTNQIRTMGVQTTNNDWNNGALSNAVPKAFPGLQT